MSFWDRLFHRSPIKKKVRAVKIDMAQVLSLYSTEVLKIEVLETVEINPSNLAYVIGVKTDAERDRLKSQRDLMDILRSLLAKHNYPSKAINDVVIDIESQETVDRESNGSWFHHLK